MILFAGSRRIGFLTILTALLLPALGVGVASADMSVGDTVMLWVPDLSEFPEPLGEHQFTCRAVTEHAYWLVQDTITVKEGSGPGAFGNPVWDSIMTQGELDTLTAEFEGGTVDVYGTVLEYLGELPDTDGDPRVWIVLATMSDYYSTSPSDRQAMVYVNPEDVDGSGDFNNQDIFYINVHSYTELPSQRPVAKALRRFSIPMGLAQLLRTAVLPTEDQWITRGLGAAAQYWCYGLTTTGTNPTNDPGLQYDLNKYAAKAYLELTYWKAGGHLKDYAHARAMEFLWFMYLAQRYDDSIFMDVAQSDTTSMLNIARAIDPTIPDSVAIQTNVTPIYNDWLICNLVTSLKDESSGGIYTYDIIPETISFNIMGQNNSFNIRITSYPFGVEIDDAAGGMMAAIWANQYCRFIGDYSEYPGVYFNGMYADEGGSGSFLDGKWTCFAVCRADNQILSITELTMDELYNSSFTLDGDSTYLVLTNNNEGGAPDLRYVVSQDSEIPDLMLSAHQNVVNDQYLTLYTTLLDTIPEGFDWYGPIFTASTADSTILLDMEVFFETIWHHTFIAWEAGSYTLSVAGYDSTGFDVSNSISASVGWVTSTGLLLDMDDIQLNISGGVVAPGTMVSICESSLLGLAMETQTPIEALSGQLTGIVAGPVSIPALQATLSFPAENSQGAVYRYTPDGWNRLHSWFQGGRMSACVSEGGVFAFGEEPGVTSPELPAQFLFGGTYPNPFSAQAAISFALPASGHVNVTIYDMSGRAIRTLTDTEMQAAEHSLIWDGLDESGNAVGTGVYFCRLQACGQTVTQKMLRIE